MGTLDFKRVSKEVENQDFDCGVASINEYVRCSYFPSIVQHAYAYNIVHNDVSLGYIQILFRDVELGSFPDDIADMDPGVKAGTIPALHIRFLAIDKRYQRKHLGSAALNIMIKRVEDMASSWPIRLITIDAIEDLVEWYEREGFVKMKKNTGGQDGVTVAMYFDCQKFSQELTEYIKQIQE